MGKIYVVNFTFVQQHIWICAYEHTRVVTVNFTSYLQHLWKGLSNPIICSLQKSAVHLRLMWSFVPRVHFVSSVFILPIIPCLWSHNWHSQRPPSINPVVNTDFSCCTFQNAPIWQTPSKYIYVLYWSWFKPEGNDCANGFSDYLPWSVNKPDPISQACLDFFYSTKALPSLGTDTAVHWHCKNGQECEAGILWAWM